MEDSFEDDCDRMDAKNKARQTIPPTQEIGQGLGKMVEYPDGTEVQYVCPCKAPYPHFLVFYEEGGYRTFVRCTSCGKQDDVHTS
jgi:hypothetical protein